MENVLFTIKEDGENISVEVCSNPVELSMALAIAFENSEQLKTIVEIALRAVEAGVAEGLEVQKTESIVETSKTQGDA